jgi:Mrp family chromosome partitioning ATPase
MMGKNTAPRSEEVKQKLRIAHTGKKPPPEVGKKISKSLTGKKQRPDVIEARAKRFRKRVQNVSTGEVFESITLASKSEGVGAAAMTLRLKKGKFIYLN